MHLLFPQGINVNQPLHRWELSSASTWLDRWNWFRTTDGSQLLYREDDSWFSYNQFQDSRSRFVTEYRVITRVGPISVERVTVENDGDYSHVTHSSRSYNVIEDTRETICLGRYTISMPKIPYLFHCMKISDDIDTLLSDISVGTALCVGDRTYALVVGSVAPEVVVNG